MEAGVTALHCKDGDPVHLVRARDPAVILAPSGLSREMRAADVMMNSDLGAAQAGEVFLSHVSARAIEAVCLLMASPLDLETLM